MSTTKGTRRDFLKAMGMGAAAMGMPIASGRAVAATVRAAGADGLLSVDPSPKYALSPYLYQQFMEPLGTTDGSVAAAWDFRRDCWREDVIETTKALGTPLLRWGGCFASYYRWKEGVGPRDQRQPMLNLLWGGVETNQVGTHEFIDFARQVGAEPFFCINMESDGRKYWMKDPKGSVRKGDANEAAEWVDYCNNPKNELRRSHGVEKPYGLKLWQLGNETSYDPIDREWGARKTVEFAKAMRQADPTIELIGWGDSGWMKMMYEIAGEHLQYLAFHHMFDPYRSEKDSPLRGIEYRKDPDRTWEYLMNSYKAHERRVRGVCEEAKDVPLPLAMTECHFFLPGRNRCEALSTWAAGVANARVLNVHERNGDLLKIATLADFCGTRWQNNAVMIPVPHGKSFMMPVAMVMSLYRKHSGKQSLEVTGTPDGLDVTASRTGDRVFLHVVNTHRTRSVQSSFQVRGRKITGGRAYWFDIDPEFEVFEYHPECTFPKERTLDPSVAWTFPAASVSAVELTMEPA